MTIREWILSYKTGKIKDSMNEKDIKKFINESEWRDWFCENDELYSRTDILSKIICSITNENILDNYTIGLYNNCPITGDLYDEIVFYSIEDSEKFGAFLKINSPYRQNVYDLITFYDFDHCNRDEFNKGNVNTIGTDSIEEIIKFLNSVDKNFCIEKK